MLYWLCETEKPEFLSFLGLTNSDISLNLPRSPCLCERGQRETEYEMISHP